MRKYLISMSVVFMALIFACSPAPDTYSIATNFIFGTNTVTGYIGALSTEPVYTYDTYDRYMDVAFPSNLLVAADSFIIVHGQFNSDLSRYSYMYLSVEFTSGTNTKYTYSIEGAGTFHEAVFLRYGPGEYKVKLVLHDASDGNNYTAAYFNVTNVSPHNFMYLMPSKSVQSLDPGIRAKAMEVIANCTNDRHRAREIHDWIVKYLRYDLESTLVENDAYEAFYTGKAVCQGYSCLAAAMFRSIGMPAKFVRGYVRDETNSAWHAEIDHGWNEVYYDGKWNIMDITWDDPLKPDSNDYPDGWNLRTNYFEPSLDYFYLQHTNWYAVDYRLSTPGLYME